MTGQLGDKERDAVLYALRHARGRYAEDRASQLSGVPRSTIYDWRREHVYVPDFDDASPVAWSYRDLAYLRFLAWLRRVGVPPPTAARRVSEIKALGRVWAPDLVVPSEYTFISPWVLTGDPCVAQTRIPTAAVYALRDERGLDTAEVVELYPGLSTQAADDAYLLERRLRGYELPATTAT